MNNEEKQASNQKEMSKLQKIALAFLLTIFLPVIADGSGKPEEAKGVLFLVMGGFIGGFFVYILNVQRVWLVISIVVVGIFVGALFAVNTHPYNKMKWKE